MTTANPQPATIATEIDTLVLRQAAAFRPTPAALADLQSRIREQHTIKDRAQAQFCGD